MTFPFSKKGDEPRESEARPSLSESVEVTNSSLLCEHCFGETTTGTYIPNSKRLFWDCVKCGRTNAVKDIEL